jgi:hypothetical protein
MHLGGRHPLGGLQLLLEPIEKVEGGMTQGQHGNGLRNLWMDRSSGDGSFWG